MMGQVEKPHHDWLLIKRVFKWFNSPSRWVRTMIILLCPHRCGCAWRLHTANTLHTANNCHKHFISITCFNWKKYQQIFIWCGFYIRNLKCISTFYGNKCILVFWVTRFTCLFKSLSKVNMKMSSPCPSCLTAGFALFFCKTAGFCLV